MYPLVEISLVNETLAIPLVNETIDFDPISQ